MPPEIGSVSTQAKTIRETTLHLIALRRFVAPTPIMEVVMVWVVEIGIPKWLAVAITVAAVVCAAKPWIGCNRTICFPSVLIMRQPPIAVPVAIVRAQTTLIHIATLNWGVMRN